MNLETAQEVVLPDTLSPRLSGTPSNFGTLVETLGSGFEHIRGDSIGVVCSWGNIGSVMVDGDLGRQGRGTGGHLLLVALALLLVQGYRITKLADHHTETTLLYQ